MNNLRINLAHVARYLGYGGKELDVNMLEQIEDIFEKLSAVSVPRVVYQSFPLENTTLVGSNLTLEGKDISDLLKNCHSCILMAVTLGQGVDRFLHKMQIQNLSSAIVADACASSMIECFCQDVNDSLEAENKGKGSFLTTRFSPGYGDLPLGAQVGLCALLESYKNIGLTTNSTYALTPSKSITAVIGVSKEEKNIKRSACRGCILSGHCHYQKGGTLCG